MPLLPALNFFLCLVKSFQVCFHSNPQRHWGGLVAIHRSFPMLKLNYNDLTDAGSPTSLTRYPLHQLGPEIFLIPFRHMKNRSTLSDILSCSSAGRWMLQGLLFCCFYSSLLPILASFFMHALNSRICTFCFGIQYRPDNSVLFFHFLFFFCASPSPFWAHCWRKQRAKRCLWGTQVPFLLVSLLLGPAWLTAELRLQQSSSEDLSKSGRKKKQKN